MLKESTQVEEIMLGVHAAFYGSVILLRNIVQILHGPMPAAAALDPFLLYVGVRDIWCSETILAQRAS